MASHPSPFHRQRQSNKTLDPTDQTAKFLYTILKQLDLKNIDWNEVAGSLDITNGHAARMRWSRFRAQIEGLDNSYSRKGYRKKESEKKRKRNKDDDTEVKNQGASMEAWATKKPKVEGDAMVKAETTPRNAATDGNSVSGFVKNERPERTSVLGGIAVHHPTVSTVTVAPPALTSSNKTRPVDASLRPGFSNNMNQVVASGGQTQSNHLNQGAPYYLPNQWIPHHATPGLALNNLQSANLISSYYNMANAMPNQTRQFMVHGHFNPRQNYGHQQLLTNIHPQRPQFIPTQAPLRSSESTNPPMLQPPSAKSSEAVSTPVASGANQQNSTNDGLPGNADKSQNLTSERTTMDATTQAEACRLASQASYPWPYSEASLAQFMHRAPESPNAGLISDNANQTEATTLQNSNTCQVTPDPSTGISEGPCVRSEVVPGQVCNASTGTHGSCADAKGDRVTLVPIPDSMPWESCTAPVCVEKTLDNNGSLVIKLEPDM